MSLAATLFLVATALTVVGLAAGLVTIVLLLLRISGALADASTHLALVPEQLAPLESGVPLLAASLADIRKAFGA